METLERLEVVRQPLETEFKVRAKLQDDCTKLGDEMSQFIPIFKREYGAPLDTMKEDSHANDQSPGITASFYCPLHFQTMDGAEFYLSLWSARLRLSMTLRQNNVALIALLGLLPPTYGLVNPDNIEFPPKYFNVKDLYMIPDTTGDDSRRVNSIARSVEYFERQDNGIMGIAPLMTPLHSAIAWFEGQPKCEEEAEWCWKIRDLGSATQAYQLHKALKVSNTAMQGGTTTILLDAGGPG